MVDLSIVIVNYNVKYFIAQCIQSILQSNLNGITTEIIVVDNNSNDDSFPYLEEKFSTNVSFIRNEKNLGFSKACNIGFSKSRGEIVLFLNPDTIVQELTLLKSYNRLVLDPALGALGVKLVDGSGQYLPESKRSFPTPVNSFIKLSGIRWKFLNKIISPYNLDHLDENSPQNVEVLCGAFLMVKNKVFSEVGGFDESYFMYGEDIDLCKRIKNEGYSLLYYPEVSIIHFKGESHKTKDWNYYKNFYAAMSVYASKHFGLLTSSLLKLGIFLAAVVALIKSWLNNSAYQIFDIIIIYITFFLVKSGWAVFYFQDANYYPDSLNFFIGLYSIILLLSLQFMGYYKKRSSFRNIIIGLGTGLMVLFVFHGIMPDNFRFSRMIILLSVALLFPLLLSSRLLVNYLLLKKWVLFNEIYRKAIVVGSESGFLGIKTFVAGSFPHINLIGRVYKEDPLTTEKAGYLGHIDQIGDLIKIYKPDEVFFNLDEININTLFTCLNKFGRHSEFKGYSKKIDAIIGNADPSRSADLYTTNFHYKITDATSRFLKRSFDMGVSLFIIILFPLFLLIKNSIIQQAVKVLIGRNTWIGYNPQDDKIEDLPRLRNGIFYVGKEQNHPDQVHFFNLQYARNYTLLLDIETFFRYLCFAKT